MTSFPQQETQIFEFLAFLPNPKSLAHLHLSGRQSAEYLSRKFRSWGRSEWDLEDRTSKFSREGLRDLIRLGKEEGMQMKGTAVELSMFKESTRGNVRRLSR